MIKSINLETLGVTSEIQLRPDLASFNLSLTPPLEDRPSPVTSSPSPPPFSTLHVLASPSANTNHVVGTQI